MKPGRPWRRAVAWLAFLAPFFYATYGLANHVAAAREGGVPALFFEWERQVPFWPWTIFPYWTINVFYGLSIFLAPNRHVLDRHAARLLTAQLVAVTCFLLAPLSFAFGQPPVSGLPALLFDALRGFDKPFNQAPSLHIALAVILWDFYRRIVPRGAAQGLLHLWTLLICGSVLTTWQHHFIDIPTGALLGVLCVWLWPLERRVALLRGWRFTAEPARRRLAGFYLIGALACLALALAIGGIGLWLCWPAVSLAVVALNYAGFGARGFCTDAHGRMAWPARWLLGPYRLAATLNALWWTRRMAPADEVVPGVWLGRLSSAMPARACVVSLCAELQAPPGVPTVCLPWLDLIVPTPAQLRRAAAAIERQHRRGQGVRVSCALGFSRSSAALACWLVRSGRAASPAQALQMIRKARPEVVLTPPSLRALALAVEAA